MNTYKVKSKYLDMPEARVETALYANGTLAVGLVDLDEREIISVNLVAYGLAPAADQFYVKNYSEHEGLAVALMQAGIAEKVGEVTYGPYESSATLLRLIIEEAPGYLT